MARSDVGHVVGSGAQVGWCSPNMVSPLMVVEVRKKTTHKQKANHKLHVYELFPNQAPLLCYPSGQPL
jgi:hypothetical protein